MASRSDLSDQVAKKRAERLPHRSARVLNERFWGRPYLRRKEYLTGFRHMQVPEVRFINSRLDGTVTAEVIFHTSDRLHDRDVYVGRIVTLIAGNCE